MQAWNASGQLVLDTADRIGRVVYAGAANASGIPNNTWTQVVPAAYSSTLWGLLVPTYALDATAANQLYLHQGSVQFDKVNRPGQLLIAGQWYDPNTGVVTNYPYDNSILIYGVW